MAKKTDSTKWAGNPSPVSVDELYIALREALKLQKHYAESLNAYDDGQRLSEVFASPETWIARLRETGALPSAGGRPGRCEVKKTDNNTHRLEILKTVDEAVRFTLHAMCLAPIGSGQAGDRAATMIVERVAERMPSAPLSRPSAEAAKGGGR